MDEDTTDGASEMLEYVSAKNWSATAFQLVLDRVKRWWLDGFAARMVNGQLAIAYPSCRHIRCIRYIFNAEDLLTLDST